MPADMKDTIAQAAKSLLMEKGVRKLTVKDIVEECSITRQAFYYHLRTSLRFFAGCLSAILSGICLKPGLRRVARRGCTASLSLP